MSLSFDLPKDAELTRKVVREFAEKEIAPVAQELDIGVPEGILSQLGSKGKLPVPAQHSLIYEAGNKYGGKQRGTDPDHQRGGKTLDGTGTEDQQDDTGEQGRHIGVNNGRAGIFIPIGNGELDAFRLLFFICRFAFLDGLGLGLWQALCNTGLLGPEQERWLAPEQASGTNGEPRSDIHALGLVLLLRLPPFDALLVRIPPLDQMTLPRFAVLIPWGVTVFGAVALDGALRGRVRSLVIRLVPAFVVVVIAASAAAGR